MNLPAESQTGITANSRSVGRPSNVDSEDTRQRVMAAALACFAECGYRETTHKQVAARAGVTEGTIFHHFRTKENLFIKCHDKVISEILETFRCAIRGKTTLKGAFAAYAKAALKLTSSHRNWPRALAGLNIEVARNPGLRIALHEDGWAELFEQMAQIGINSGEIEASKKSVLRAALTSANLGLGQFASVASAKQHRDALKGFTALFSGTLILPG